MASLCGRASVAMVRPPLGIVTGSQRKGAMHGIRAKEIEGMRWKRSKTSGLILRQIRVTNAPVTTRTW
jgi:hypothetical protein